MISRARARAWAQERGERIIAAGILHIDDQMLAGSQPAQLDHILAAADGSAGQLAQQAAIEAVRFARQRTRLCARSTSDPTITSTSTANTAIFNNASIIVPPKRIAVLGI